MTPKALRAALEFFQKGMSDPKLIVWAVHRGDDEGPDIGHGSLAADGELLVLKTQSGATVNRVLIATEHIIAITRR